MNIAFWLASNKTPFEQGCVTDVVHRSFCQEIQASLFATFIQ